MSHLPCPVLDLGRCGRYSPANMDTTPESMPTQPNLRQANADPSSPARIHSLTSDVVDQIAAGEVVERPAHLVKELVENALDAGASQVEIEYDHGGRRVRVTDDGSGIERDDLALALARHATSKIDSFDDLWRLSTFGFRGEALASIAAVSRLTLQSRTAHSESAHHVVAEYGRVNPAEPVGGNLGTTVLVEDLFGNVPARLKFMKSEAGETSQIKATLKAIALAHEGAEFRLRSKGKLEHVWPRAESFLERSKQILDVGKLYEHEFAFGDFKGRFVFASPHDVAGNARNIWIFVQGRWVQDRSLQAAVIEAYRGLLMHGEYPIAIVRLTCPPEDVDVNIHPAKSQVKFRDPQVAFRTVNRGLREALEQAPWLKANDAASRSAGESSVQNAVNNFSRDFAARSPGAEKNHYGATSSRSERKMSVAELTRPYRAGSSDEAQVSVPLAQHSEHLLQQTHWQTQSDGRADARGMEPSFEMAPPHSTARFEAPEFSTVQFRQRSDVGASQGSIHGADSSAASRDAYGTLSASIEGAKAPGVWSRLQVLGQAHLTYVVCQDSDRLVLVDQHAAHERVVYERLMRAWQEGGIETQNLLIPLAIDMEPEYVEALQAASGELEKMGVAIDPLGPQSIAVRSMPALLKESAIAKALTDLAREMHDRGGSFALEKRIADLCATMACHSVVRAGQALSVDQMKSLLAQMDEFPLSSFCPHGRPVSVDYPFAKLERDFGRIV